MSSFELCLLTWPTNIRVVSDNDVCRKNVKHCNKINTRYENNTLHYPIEDRFLKKVFKKLATLLLFLIIITVVNGLDAQAIQDCQAKLQIFLRAHILLSHSTVCTVGIGISYLKA